MGSSISYRQLLEALERRLLVTTLVAHGWDRRAAAKSLGIPTLLLTVRCRHFGLSALQPQRRAPVSRPSNLLITDSPFPTKRPAGKSGTKLGKWRELPPPSTQAHPMSVYLDRRAIIDRMLGEGATYAEIGVALGGLTRERVRQLCHRLGLDHHAGQRARANQSLKRAAERWRRNLDPQAASAVTWLDRQGVIVEPQARHRFKVGAATFCVHLARAARSTSSGHAHLRYYHFHGMCSVSTNYIVCVSRDGRRFVIPQSQWGASIYIPERDDGAWGGFRDRWPMLASERSA